MGQTMNPTHSLVWDGLVLDAAGSPVFTDAGYAFTVVGESFDLGAAVPVDAVVSSLLFDGDLTRTDRWGNREAKFVVEVRSANDDGTALSLGEAALMAKVGRACLLVWTPPQAGAPSSVIEVQTSHLDPIYDDMLELNGRRSYTLTLTCLPWVRAATQTVVDFSAASTAAPTVVDDCSSTSRFTPGTGGTPTTISATTYNGNTVIQVNTVTQYEPDNGQNYFRGQVFWTVPSGFTSNMLAIDYAVPAGLQVSGYVFGGTGWTLVSQQQLSNGNTRKTYRATSAPAAGSTIGIGFDGLRSDKAAQTTPVPVGYLDNILQASAPLTSVLAANVGGSVRTTGALTVSRSAALGHLTVYADPSMLSSGWSPDNLDSWWAAPAGRYAVYVDTNSNTGSTLSDTVVINGQSTSATYPTPAVAGTWVCVGRVSLTARRDKTIGGAAGGVTVTRNGNAVTSSSAAGQRVRIFRMGHETKMIHLPTVTSGNVTIDSPSTDYPNGFISSDGIAVDLSGFFTFREQLDFRPGMCGLFVDFDNLTSQPVTRTLTYYKRANTYVAEAS